MKNQSQSINYNIHISRLDIAIQRKLYYKLRQAGLFEDDIQLLMQGKLRDIQDNVDFVYDAVEYFKQNHIESIYIVNETLHRIDIEWVKLFLFISSNISKNVDYHSLKYNLIHIWKDYSL